LSDPRQGAPKEGFVPTNLSALIVNGIGQTAFGSASPGLPWLTTSYMPIPLSTWVHIAVVWDDDWSGYAFYINGQLAQHMKSNGPLTDIIYERIRIGSDGSDQAGGWSGGMAWFRGFDYRLSTDQLTTDMNDDWANLV